MKKLQFKRIGILIAFTLVVSIGVQIYRNISQFKQIETQLTKDIQVSLDNALEAYFADLAKTDVVTLTESEFLEKSDSSGNDGLENNSLNFFNRIGKSKIVLKTLEGMEGIDSLHASWSTNDSLSFSSISTQLNFDSLTNKAVDKENQINIFRGLESADSIRHLKMLTNTIIISITRDSLNFEKINDLFQADLDRKGININYGLLHLAKDTIAGSYNYPDLQEMPFKTVTKSTFLPRGETLELYFENTALNLVKRGIFEILTSITFLGIISYALYFLYRTIRNQKEVAEIKQDLISNITHEFKTPIATTLSAIEGIEQFNPNNDPEKNKRYLGISKVQLHKLNNMVEKLLETATLDSEQLMLQKEETDVVPILRSLLQKYQTLAPEKSIDLEVPSYIKPVCIDAFHFENAISNLIDNALKYGGDQIRICLQQSEQTIIKVWDNGGKITSEQRDRIFEQFYRIPQGNLHDVKGFGIGLYYVKKILEKHDGKISLQTSKNSTSFITAWP
ncbi:sensor histidine kinase [Algoriphagus machipongonensis]|uniref:histidine kinase n=1 Tax=Algoriphagus machipongonensis TaxID=388413 RepID=A3HZ24_9BACT|nr:HAMP domain-containing sensor histidine kinase [Algoriphagus machipongonensis]EAZ80510.1 two-component system sensor histidine kinase [Algoriphagus machipongonensis]